MHTSQFAPLHHHHPQPPQVPLQPAHRQPHPHGRTMTCPGTVWLCVRTQRHVCHTPLGIPVLFFNLCYSADSHTPKAQGHGSVQLPDTCLARIMTCLAGSMDLAGLRGPSAVAKDLGAAALVSTLQCWNQMYCCIVPLPPPPPPPPLSVFVLRPLSFSLCMS